MLIMKCESRDTERGNTKCKQTKKNEREDEVILFSKEALKEWEKKENRIANI